MPTTARRLLDSPVVRFLLVGGLNTLVTGALVIALSYVLPGWLAFTIAFALGLVFSVLATGTLVFRTRFSAARAALYAGAYLVIYLVGVGFVQLVETLGAPAWVNGTSVLITAPLSFLAGRFIFRRGTTPS